MGLGFSPLPYRLQLNSRTPSTVQPESNGDREPLVENSSRRQQQSVLALLRQPRVETMELSAVNSRECTRSGGHKT